MGDQDSKGKSKLKAFETGSWEGKIRALQHSYDNRAAVLGAASFYGTRPLWHKDHCHQPDI